MSLDGTPFLVQAVYSFKGKNNDEVMMCVCVYIYIYVCITCEWYFMMLYQHNSGLCYGFHFFKLLMLTESTLYVCMVMLCLSIERE
jgi:hypothetical protein